MSLPDALAAAIAGWLAAEGEGGARRRASAELSATYRAGGSSSRIDLGSYLVARLPATFAAVSRVLAELAALRPDFAPRSLLDAGSGPGTAAWAAAGLWGALARVTLLDSSPAFLALAAGLARHGPPPLAGAAAVQGDLARLPAGLSADLVIAAYALAELPVERAALVAEGLWQAAGHCLVLVEPGTPQGFARLRAARGRLLGQGAVPVAPCTHAEACPLTGTDWCHFSVRLARSRAHMHAKDARVPFEDERFAYLVLARGGQPIRAARILSPPQHAKPGITLRLCADGRVSARHVARREAQAHKTARKLVWGDLFGMSQQEDDA